MTTARSEVDVDISAWTGRPLRPVRKAVKLSLAELHAFQKDWRGEPVERRLNYLLHDLFVMHPLLAAIAAAVIQRGEELVMTGRGRGFLVICPPDGGKTTLIDWLRSEFPTLTITEPDPMDESLTIERTEIPFLWIDVPAPCTMTTFLEAILEAIGSPARTFKTPKKRLEFVIEQLKIARVRFLAVDNVQDVPDKTGPRTTKTIGNLIRGLIDKPGLVAILLGTQEARIVVSSNDQLRKRVKGLLSLGPYDVDSPEQLAKCMEMISKVEERLPLSGQAGLAKGALGRGLSCAINGNIGTLVDLLAIAIPRAVKDGRECVILEDVKTAYELLFLGYAEEVDPFAPKFVPRRLNLPGEPHFTALDDRNARRRKSREPH